MPQKTMKFKQFCTKEATALCGFVFGFATATIVLGVVLYFSGQFLELFSILDAR